MLPILTLLTISYGIRLEPMFEVPAPGGVYTAMADPASGNLVWRSSAEDNGVYLLDTAAKKVSRLGEGNIERPRIDCGKGLLTLSIRKDGVMLYETYDLRNGKKLGTIQGDVVRRVGGVIETREGFFDVAGGLLKARVPAEWNKPHPDYIGTLIWDGKRRLAIVGQGDKPNDVKDVVEILPDWSKGKRVHLSDFAFGFENIVGNPDVGPFGVLESSNRWIYNTGLYSMDLVRIPQGDLQLIFADAGPYGILAREFETSKGYVDPDLIGGICLDATTGKVKWRSEKPGTWLGSDVFVGDALLDGRTGKVKARLDYGKRKHTVLGRAGNTIFTRTTDDRIAVFRLIL